MEAAIAAAKESLRSGGVPRARGRGEAAEESRDGGHGLELGNVGVGAAGRQGQDLVILAKDRAGEEDQQGRVAVVRGRRRGLIDESADIVNGAALGLVERGGDARLEGVARNG